MSDGSCPTGAASDDELFVGSWDVNAETSEEQVDRNHVDEMKRAAADLWTQVVAEGDDFIVFADHFGDPARVRLADGGYLVAWVQGEGDDAAWDEYERLFENPRQAALHAFQGPEMGRI